MRVMGRSISEVLTFAIGVAISPAPIIAVILTLGAAAGLALLGVSTERRRHLAGRLRHRGQRHDHRPGCPRVNLIAKGIPA